MGARLLRVKRGGLLLCLWTLAVLLAVRAVNSAIEYEEQRNATASAQAAYERDVDALAGRLAAAEELKRDPEARVELLKSRMGYARPNDTPIVVQIEEQE